MVKLDFRLASLTTLLFCMHEGSCGCVTPPPHSPEWAGGKRAKHAKHDTLRKALFHPRKLHAEQRPTRPIGPREGFSPGRRRGVLPPAPGRVQRGRVGKVVTASDLSAVISLGFMRVDLAPCYYPAHAERRGVGERATGVADGEPFQCSRTPPRHGGTSTSPRRCAFLLNVKPFLGMRAPVMAKSICRLHSSAEGSPQTPLPGVTV
ncbi:hypothetical protein SKAU_G00128720 [Synaphobranchus kaupii]|uniref:Secreted protein n=1 Tax=Synaphobranchus kaupii TaxID=118154 RepID=A0A9Q1J2S7_SYNKA|nr:hypothetical protein SKAU_G00128720 [Synaphobranchus kaupii]